MNIKKDKLLSAILASMVGVSGVAIAQERVDSYDRVYKDRQTQSMERQDRIDRQREGQSTMDNIQDSVSDTATVTKVNAKFATSSVVDALDINVDARDGTVFLRGHVANVNEKNEAIRLAQEIDGVTRVDSSDLIIDPQH